jgi:hypothetical protein
MPGRDFEAALRTGLPAGPAAIVLAEDRAALDATLDRLRRLGFGAIVLVRDPALGPLAAQGTVELVHPLRSRKDAIAAVNRLLPQLVGRWVHVAFNAEFLFYPYCETRSVRDLAAFMEEERREAVFTTVVDLYACDLTAHLSGVATGACGHDGAGYFAFEAWEDGRPLERQVELHGGLGRRFEEHVPWTSRRVDRIAFFRAAKGRVLDEAFRLNEPELNTVNCAWHRNVTAVLASFRVAKALMRNPDSAASIAGFGWELSRPFGWSSAELLAQGFMERGQWF